MQCSRCLTELPDATTYCSNCGSFLRSDPAGASTVFSYLPAGAPPWPTTIPQNLRGDTGPTVDAAGSNQAIKTRRSTRSILQIVGVLLLIPLLGVGSTLGILFTQGNLSFGRAQTSASQQSSSKLNSSALTPTATTAQQTNVLPAPAPFKKTDSQDVNISLQYPSDWIADAPQKSTDVTFVAFHPSTSQQQIAMDFVIGRLTDSGSAQFQSPDDLNTTRLSNLSAGQGINNLRDIPTPTPQITIGGAQWVQRDAMFTDNVGNNVHITTLSVLHNKIYYNITFLIPDAYYNEAVQKYAQPMLNSIQFLS